MWSLFPTRRCVLGKRFSNLSSAYIAVTPALAAVTLSCITLFMLPRTANAQMVTGSDMPGFRQTFGLAAGKEAIKYTVREMSVKTPTGTGANVLWSGEKATFTFKFTNKTAQEIVANGNWETIPYATTGVAGDIWAPHVARTGNSVKIPLQVRIPANGTTTVTVTPIVGERFGGYGLIADLGDYGRSFAATMVRTLKADPGRVQSPTYALDIGWPFEVTEATAVLFERLGIKGCRMGEGFKPAGNYDFAASDPSFVQQLNWSLKHNITVMLTLSDGGAAQPLGRARPWLDTTGKMLDTKSDYAWLPEQDGEFRKWTSALVGQYGFPKGAVNAVELWNEPWEGISISGWGADMLRYRDMYRNMALGVVDARKMNKVDVLIGGACSSSNTRDKLFADGSDEFLPYLDFVSIHYQPLAADPVVEKRWALRDNGKNPVRVWDTESWIANSDDRVAGVIASMRAQGQERTAGIFGGNVFRSDVITDNPRLGIVQAWSPAASVAASQKFIGQRKFKEILFKNGLPWVFRFDAERIGGDTTAVKPDDGTLVVMGDLGGVYERNRVLWRTVTGIKNQNRLEAAKMRLMNLPANTPENKRKAAEDAVSAAQIVDGATLAIDNPRHEFVLHDFYGNPVGQGTKIVVPLNGLGYFLRTNGNVGSFARLVAAVRAARIDGYTPVDIVAHDMTGADGQNAKVRVTLTNILNRTVRGTVTMVESPTRKQSDSIVLAAHETRTVSFPRALGSRPDNNYPLEFVADMGADGKNNLHETLHCNLIAKKTITVDGDLKDWANILPQSAHAGNGAPSLTQLAYQPFKAFDAGIAGGQTVAYTAYDDSNFYFAAKIADTTPYDGNVRFETRDDDQYFYPEKTYAKAGAGLSFSIRWMGKVAVPESGTYRFVTTSDDGVRLWLNGKMVIDNWTEHAATDNEAILDLKKGEPLDIKMEYFQGAGGAVAKLYWQKPSGERTPVAASYATEIYHGRDLSGTPITRTDSSIDFTWNSGDLPDSRFANGGLDELTWNPGVRRYSYRKDPDLPSGNGTDNVQLAFNVLPPDQKGWFPHPPGTMDKFISYRDTDYEFSLNQVAEKFGGGTEIFCLQRPQMPFRKHFYPRQPKAPTDGGAVHSGKLTMRRDGNTRIVECAIPWSEMPEVKAQVDAGKTIKFSYRVNDNKGPSYELAAGRSVSKDNPSFHNDWEQHWANELEFGFER